MRPQKARSAKLCFFNDYLEEIQEKYQLDVRQSEERMDYIWLEMTDKQRKLYYEKESLDLKRFNNEIKEYKDQGNDIADAESYEPQEEDEEQDQESEAKDFEMEDNDQGGYLQQYIDLRKNQDPPKKPLSSFFIFSHNYI